MAIVINTVISFYAQHDAGVVVEANQVQMSKENIYDAGNLQVLAVYDNGTQEVVFTWTQPFVPASASGTRTYPVNLTPYAVGGEAKWAPSGVVIPGLSFATLTKSPQGSPLTYVNRDPDKWLLGNFIHVTDTAAGGCYYQVVNCRPGYEAQCPYW